MCIATAKSKPHMAPTAVPCNHRELLGNGDGYRTKDLLEERIHYQGHTAPPPCQNGSIRSTWPFCLHRMRQEDQRQSLFPYGRKNFGLFSASWCSG